MPNKSIAKGRATSIVVVSALYNPHLIPIGFQAPCEDKKEDGRDEEVLLQKRRG